VPRRLLDDLSPRLLKRLRYARLLSLFDTGAPALRAYQAMRAIFPWRNAKELMATDRWEVGWCFPELLDGSYPDIARDWDDFQCVSVLEGGMYMRSQLLRDIDNFSMAHSLEVRAPYLDHHLFSFVLELPSKLKQTRGRTKPLLADALPKPLPDEVLRRPKRGFTFPVEEWMKSSLGSDFEEIALAPRNADLWNLEVIRKVWAGFKQGRVHWSVPWEIYAFARWRAAHCQ
jgi:hypothetical protein